MLVPPRTLGQDHHPLVTQFHRLVNGLCCILDGGAFGLGLDYPTTQSSTATSLLCISGLATCGKSTQALSGHCSREWNLSHLQNHLLCVSEQKNWELHGQLLFILSLHIESLLPLCEALARLTLDSVLASKETAAYTGQYIIITMWWELTKRYNWGAWEHREEKAAWSDGLWAQRWAIWRGWVQGDPLGTRKCRDKASTTEAWTAPPTRGAWPCLQFGFRAQGEQKLLLITRQRYLNLWSSFTVH